MRHIEFAIRWLVILAIGAVLAIFIDTVVYHRYVDRGIGEYYGVLHGTFRCYRPFSSLEFEARSPSEFRLSPPGTYTYDSLQIKITSEAGEETGVLSVPEMKFATGAKNINLSVDKFSALILGDNPMAHEGFEATSSFFELLKSAGNGQFTRPRHHTYQIPSYDPGQRLNDGVVGGSFVHFSCGKRVSSLLAYWVIACLIGMVFHAVRDRIKK